MVARNKCGGYWNKTRSTVDSGGLCVTCMISITNMFSTNRHNHHSSCLTVSYRTQSSQRPETSSCLPKTEAFPSSFRYAREACDGDYHLNISNSNSMNHQYALESLIISSQQNNEKFRDERCCNRIKQDTTISCQGSECLPSSCVEAGCILKLLKVFFSLHKSYLKCF